MGCSSGLPDALAMARLLFRTYYILDRVQIQFNQNSIDLKPLGVIMKKLF
jgi:hypothetical protein